MNQQTKESHQQQQMPQESEVPHTQSGQQQCQVNNVYFCRSYIRTFGALFPFALDMGNIWDDYNANTGHAGVIFDVPVLSYSGWVFPQEFITYLRRGWRSFDCGDFEVQKRMFWESSAKLLTGQFVEHKQEYVSPCLRLCFTITKISLDEGVPQGIITLIASGLSVA